jgi:gamma-glutamyl:cysteine ligase YbdK (ATP-grasp superfamily)
MADESPSTSPEAITRLNLRIADLVKDLDTADLVEVLAGRASWLLAADDNQNKNQGRRADLT